MCVYVAVMCVMLCGDVCICGGSVCGVVRCCVVLCGVCSVAPVYLYKVSHSLIIPTAIFIQLSMYGVQ